MESNRYQREKAIFSQRETEPKDDFILHQATSYQYNQSISEQTLDRGSFAMDIQSQAGNILQDITFKERSNSNNEILLSMKGIGRSITQLQDTYPLILKCHNGGVHLIEIEPLLLQLFSDGKTKPSHLVKNKLWRSTSPNRVDIVYTCDRLKSTDYTFLIVGHKFSENVANLEGKLVQDNNLTLTCLNMPQNLIIIKKGGRKGLLFITEKDWNIIKNKGDLLSEKCKKIVEEFDAYFALVKNPPNIETPSKNTLHETENKLLSNHTIISVEKGMFDFDSSSAIPFTDFERTGTVLDEAINNWVDTFITPKYIYFQQINHDYITSNREIGLKSFAANNSAMLSFACTELFIPKLLPQYQNSFRRFKAIGEVPGLSSNGLPDLSISLVHKTSAEHKVVLLQEEKATLEKLDSSCSQVAQYCQDLIKINKYPYIYCLLYAQKSKEIRLVRFNQVTKESKSFDDLVIYSGLFPLVDVRNNQIDLETMKKFFRIMLKLILDQLSALNMVNN